MKFEISPESNRDIRKKKKFLKKGNELQYLQILKTFINLMLLGMLVVMLK